LSIRYYVDPETGLPHIYGHDVEETEVEEVLSNPGEDRPGREGSHELQLERHQTGRYSQDNLLFPDPEPNSAFVITAYELRGKTINRHIVAAEGK